MSAPSSTAADETPTNAPVNEVKRLTRCFDIGGSGIKTAILENGFYKEGSYQHLGIVPPESSIIMYIDGMLEGKYREEIERPDVDFFISSAGLVNSETKSILDDWKGGGIERFQRDWVGVKEYKFSYLFGIKDESRLTVCSDVFSHTLGLLSLINLDNGIYCSITLGTGVVASLFEICNGDVFFLTPQIFAESSKIPTSFRLSSKNSLYQSVDIWDFLGNGHYQNGTPYGLTLIKSDDKMEIATARLHHLISYIRFKYNMAKTTPYLRGSDIKFFINGGSTQFINEHEFINDHIIHHVYLPMLAFNYFKSGKKIIERNLKSVVLCPPIKTTSNKSSGGARRKSIRKKSSLSRKTRKSSRLRRGGFRGPLKDIYTLNEHLKPENMIGFDKITTVTGITVEDIIRCGVFFNTSAVEHSEELIVGVGRLIVYNRGEDDILVDGSKTTVANRHPYSRHHPWRLGWGIPADGGGSAFDLPVFFMMIRTEDNPDGIRVFFFTMNYTLTLMSYKTNTLIKQYDNTTSLEDPRIAMCNNFYILYCHTGSYNGENYQSAGIGQNRMAELELKPRGPSARVQLPLISYIHTSFITEMLDVLKVNKMPLTFSIPNSNWKLLCANFLPPSTEKNLAIIPREDHSRIDFIFSLGEPVTKNLVIFQLPISHLINYSSLGESCGYVESETGTMLYSIIGITTKRGNVGTTFKKENNSIFSRIATTINHYAKQLMISFASYLATVQPGPLSDGLNYIKNGQRMFLQFTKPTTAQLHHQDFDPANLPSLLKQISSGGPVAKKIGGDGTIDGSEVLGVGHLKMDFWLMYVLYTYCKIRKNKRDTGDQAFANTINALETIIMDNDSIFKYNYDYIEKKPVMAWGVMNLSENAIPVSKPSLHAHLMYTGFIFKLNLAVYTITALSQQFLITENSNLEFINTITNVRIGGNNGYMIPYGEADALGKICFVKEERMRRFLSTEFYTSSLPPHEGRELIPNAYDEAIARFLKFDIMEEVV
jgi:hypothetical protein